MQCALDIYAWTCKYAQEDVFRSEWGCMSFPQISTFLFSGFFTVTVLVLK